MRKPIKVLPYEKNAIEYLIEELIKFPRQEGDLLFRHVLVLFPHRRPILYLKEGLRAVLKKPFVPPRAFSLEDFVQLLSLYMEERPKRLLRPIDQAWLIYLSAKEAKLDEIGDFDSFFPWGLKLSELFEEFFEEMVEPVPLSYLEGIPRKAKRLFEALDSIWRTYNALLDRNGFTTPAKRKKEIAQKVEILPHETVPHFALGFYALTKSEDLLFRGLWEKGTQFIWQAPKPLPPLLERWQKEWGAEVEYAWDSPPMNTVLHFVEAYDVHSQISKALSLFRTDGEHVKQALILVEPSLLLPLVEELPEDLEVNITLGYPLDQTPFWGFIEQVLRLIEGSDRKKGYYHKDYLSIVRHPFLRSLNTPGGKPVKGLFHLLERLIVERLGPYFDRYEVESLIASEWEALKALGYDPKDALSCIGSIHNKVLKPLEEVETLDDLIRGLKTLMEFLYPLLKESSDLLANTGFSFFQSKVIPVLEGLLIKRVPIRRRFLFQILRYLVSGTRIPFEGEPLVDLQVMGLLESRLLQFDRVIFLQLNEGVIPSQRGYDPILPPSLRPVLGLPEREREEQIIWYHFERLVKSSREVYLLWQNSVASTSKHLEIKASRSRFVERLLWEEERKRRELLDGQIERIPLSIPPSHFPKKEGIPKEKERAKLTLLSLSQGKGISATLLNTYLECPLKFYYKYTLGLEPPRAVVEEVEGDLLGELLHRTLEDYFKPFIGKTYNPKKDNDPDLLYSIFLGHLDSSPLSRLGPEKRFFLQEAVKFRLKEFLEHQKGSFDILALEKEMTLTLKLLDYEWKFYGKIDRIDRRGDKIMILDYKTGSVKDPPSIKSLLECPLPQDLDWESLALIRRKIRDLQLPLYLFLYSGGNKKALFLTNAAYVVLSRSQTEEQEREKRLIKNHVETWANWLSESLPRVLGFLLKHIMYSDFYFKATDEESCQFCDYEPICHFSW